MDRRRGLTPPAIYVVRWVARLWGAVAALILLAFLAEHVQEWLWKAAALPPTSVFVALGFHLLLLIGLIVAWRWELQGALLALVGAAGFCVASGGGWRLVFFVGVMSAPALGWLACVGLSRRTLKHQVAG